MPARVIVYCRKSVAGLSAESLRHELDLADLYTLAESLNLPEGEEAAVDAIKSHLRIERKPGKEFTYCEVHWKPTGRPIQIERVIGAEAKGEIEETLEEGLPPSKSAGAKRVREHLRSCVEIVHFEMGIPDSNHLGATLAE